MLEWVEPEDADRREAEWTAYLMRCGAPLENQILRTADGLGRVGWERPSDAGYRWNCELKLDAARGGRLGVFSPPAQGPNETPSEPGPQAGPAPLSGDVVHPHALELAKLRDWFESMIHADSLADPDTVERRRDALNYALERIAPELA